MDSHLVVERRPTSVQFFFDPQCPFAYQTSRWIREVARQTGLHVDWRFFSLEEGNREDYDTPPWELEWSPGWSLLRVAAWLRERDPKLVDRWYAAVGHAIHEQGRPAYERPVAEEIVAEMGFPADAIEQALADPATNEMVRADHEWLVANHGGFGVPTLVLPNDRAIYGPVVAPAPQGEEALHLWDLVLQVGSRPYLYELKVPRAEADMQRFKEVFAPTFRARELAGRA